VRPPPPGRQSIAATIIAPSRPSTNSSTSQLSRRPGRKGRRWRWTRRWRRRWSHRPSWYIQDRQGIINGGAQIAEAFGESPHTTMTHGRRGRSAYLPAIGINAQHRARIHRFATMISAIQWWSIGMLAGEYVDSTLWTHANNKGRTTIERACVLRPSSSVLRVHS